MRFIVNVRPDLRHEFWFPQSKPDPHSPQCLTITLNGDGTIKNQVMMQTGDRMFHTAKKVGKTITGVDKKVEVRICVIRAAHIEKDQWNYGDQPPYEILPLTRKNAGGWNCALMEKPNITEIFETHDGNQSTNFQQIFEGLNLPEDKEPPHREYFPKSKYEEKLLKDLEERNKKNSDKNNNNNTSNTNQDDVEMTDSNNNNLASNADGEEDGEKDDTISSTLVNPNSAGDSSRLQSLTDQSPQPSTFLPSDNDKDPSQS